MVYIQSGDYFYNSIVHVLSVYPSCIAVRAKLAASGNPEAFLASHPLSTRLWGSSKETSNLNPKQKEAIKKALKYKFTLIQGPPGKHICKY